MNQLMVEVQEVRDKVNTLNDATEFFDPLILKQRAALDYPTFPVSL